MNEFKAGVYKKQLGFSLVELMVAMVVGLIIALGAGQLFITVFQINRQVETLSEKQAAVNFAAETLVRDLRRAVPGSISWENDDQRLLMSVPNQGDLADCSDVVTKLYRISNGLASQGVGRALQLAQSCGDVVPVQFEDVATGFMGFDIDDSQDASGVWVVKFDLVSTGTNISDLDEFEFKVVNRNVKVVNL